MCKRGYGGEGCRIGQTLIMYVNGPSSQEITLYSQRAARSRGRGLGDSKPAPKGHPSGSVQEPHVQQPHTR